MSEIKDILVNRLNEKIDRPFYGTFIGSWCIWNWKLLYITLFINSDLLWLEKGMLKVDYITNFYSWTNHPVYTTLHVFILPFISVLIIMYPLSWMAKIFYGRSLDIRNANELIALGKENDLLKSKQKNLDITKDITKDILAIQEQEKAIVKSVQTQEKEWDDEFNAFKNSAYFNYLSEVESAIYSNQGYIDRDNKSAKVISYFDINEIIKIDSEESNYIKIVLTKKGRHFLKKYKDILSKANELQ